MTREELLSRLYDRFIRPTEQKRESFIGVEIEMPIVNLNNEAVDFAVVHKLTAAFLSRCRSSTSTMKRWILPLFTS